VHGQCQRVGFFFFFKDDFSKPNEKLAQWTTRDLGLALRTVFFFLLKLKRNQQAQWKMTQWALKKT
jgi:hypothetical protein